MSRLSARLDRLGGNGQREMAVVFVLPHESEAEKIRERFGEAGPPDNVDLRVFQIVGVAPGHVA